MRSGIGSGAKRHSRPDRFSGDDGDRVADLGLWLVHADLSVLVSTPCPASILFQGPARWLIVTLVALCALAGFGMQQVLDRGVSRKATTRLIFLGLALSLAGLAASFVLKGRVETFGPATLRLGALLLLAGWLFRSDLQKPKWIAALVFVVALDLITAHVRAQSHAAAGHLSRGESNGGSDCRPTDRSGACSPSRRTKKRSSLASIWRTKRPMASGSSTALARTI